VRGAPGSDRQAATGGLFQADFESVALDKSVRRDEAKLPTCRQQALVTEQESRCEVNVAFDAAAVPAL
jgi:hypothetical protein